MESIGKLLSISLSITILTACSSPIVKSMKKIYSSKRPRCSEVNEIPPQGCIDDSPEAAQLEFDLKKVD